ncbi:MULTISPECIES: hypothetical protein [Agrobacterium]|uniref:hypothetical protein n=1 Tax=Agrobacterium TaxID=357 RepID=UPI0012D3536B|nr:MULTISPECIES: hypothetical protein [Agrobacterium]
MERHVEELGRPERAGRQLDRDRVLKETAMGQKYAAFDAEGQITGFYDSIDSPPPETLDVLEISHDEWLMLISGFGYTIKDGAIVAPPPAEEIPLSEIKAKLKARVDALAEAERKRYITPGEGQAMTYQRKVEEAKRAILEEEPTAADYTMLAASLGVDGETVKEVATIVLAMDAAWAVIGAGIEKVRMNAKKAIDGAASADAANAIVDAIVWPEGVAL